MPTDWQYHADGVSTAVQTDHDLAGDLQRVRVELDAFKVRRWAEDEDEIEARSGKDLKHFHYDEETDAYAEYADGCHATIRFSVNDAGGADLESIEPEDGDRVTPQHMMLLPAAERVVRQLQGVDDCYNTLETLAEEYHHAGDVHIDALDRE